METPSSGRGEFQATPEQATDFLIDQAAICETLSTHPEYTFSDIPQDKHESVMLHVLTCQDRIHHVPGMPLGEE